MVLRVQKKSVIFALGLVHASGDLSPTPNTCAPTPVSHGLIDAAEDFTPSLEPDLAHADEHALHPAPAVDDPPPPPVPLAAADDDLAPAYVPFFFLRVSPFAELNQ